MDEDEINKIISSSNPTHPQDIAPSNPNDTISSIEEKLSKEAFPDQTSSPSGQPPSSHPAQSQNPNPQNANSLPIPVIAAGAGVAIVLILIIAFIVMPALSGAAKTLPATGGAGKDVGTAAANTSAASAQTSAETGAAKQKLLGILNARVGNTFKYSYDSTTNGGGRAISIPYTVYFNNGDDFRADMGNMSRFYAKGSEGYSCADMGKIGGGWGCMGMNLTSKLGSLTLLESMRLAYLFLDPEKVASYPDKAVRILPGRKIAGQDGNCFNVLPMEMLGLAANSPAVENMTMIYCFTNDGVPLYRQIGDEKSISAPSTDLVSSVSYGVDESVFELPKSNLPANPNMDDAKQYRSDSYWRGEARPFAILEHSLSGSKLTVVIQNVGSQQMSVGTILFSGTPSSGNLVPQSLNSSFAAGEKRQLSLNLQSGCAPGQNYELNTSITYSSADGSISKKVQAGAKPLFGKCS